MAQIAVAVPITLSMEDYRRDWEPRGWRLLIIGPTVTWRQDWGEWEAIRDIVQNALDETEKYYWGYDAQGLWIADEGKGVAVEHFLLGPPKLKAPHARGRFGEGMKIAALALLRKGYSVRVETVARELWLVFLRVEVNGEADQLAALWRPNGKRVGTWFHIVGYKGPAFEDRFAVNIPLQHILHESPSPLHEPIRRFNQLIGEPFQGRIYARDIYMKDIKSPWSYNLWGFELAPARHGPKDETQMWADMSRLWAACPHVPLLERLLGMLKRPPEEDTDEAHHVTFDSWTIGVEPVSGKRYFEFIKDNASAWSQAWRNKFGEWAVVETEPRLRGLVEHLGYTGVQVPWGVESALAQAIKMDKALIRESQERLGEAQVIPDERLNRTQLTHLLLARKIAVKVIYTPPEGVHAAVIPMASERMRTAGMYSKDTRRVFISLDQLENARTTVDTIIHELAHHTSGEEDLSEGHSRELTRLAARVVEETGKGSFDEELKEAVW